MSIFSAIFIPLILNMLIFDQVYFKWSAKVMFINIITKFFNFQLNLPTICGQITEKAEIPYHATIPCLIRFSALPALNHSI